MKPTLQIRLAQYHPGYARKFRALHGNQVTRASCAFEGCPMPPEIAVYRTGLIKSRALCCAHHKQRCRGQALRPFRPRSDINAAWERWAEILATPRQIGLGLTHTKCGAPMSVLATAPNGKRGVRYCWCAACALRVVVEADGSQRKPRGLA